MVMHGLVRDSFGNSIIIPMLKDKNGNVDSLDNYRAITLIPMISTLFELVILELYSHGLSRRYDGSHHHECDL